MRHGGVFLTKGEHLPDTTLCRGINEAVLPSKTFLPLLGERHGAVCSMLLDLNHSKLGLNLSGCNVAPDRAGTLNTFSVGLLVRQLSPLITGSSPLEPRSLT